jgi:hypothetical protein
MAQKKSGQSVLPSLCISDSIAGVDAGQILLENGADAPATEAVDAGERPDAGPGTAGKQLHAALIVTVGYGGESLDRVGVDVDALGDGGIG